MRRTDVRRGLRVLLLASCVWVGVAGTGTALATTITYSGDGTTLIVTGGDAANHDIRFRLSADSTHDEIHASSVPAMLRLRITDGAAKTSSRSGAITLRR